MDTWLERAAWAKSQHYSSVLAIYEEILLENGIKKDQENGLGINTGAIIDGADIVGGWGRCGGRGAHPHQWNQDDHNGNSSNQKLLLFNAKSIAGKAFIIQDFILDENADLACVTETCWQNTGVLLSSRFFCQAVLCYSRIELEGGEVEWPWNFILLNKCFIQQSANFEHMLLRSDGQNSVAYCYWTVHFTPSVPEEVCVWYWTDPILMTECLLSDECFFSMMTMDLFCWYLVPWM